jgi:hypothetical protein
MTRSGAINHLNTLLILASCFLAYQFPFHLLIFSYAFLGPAHYLTQISWLHDRDYFVQKKSPAVPALVVLTLLITAQVYPPALGIAFMVALAAVLPWKLPRRIAAGVAGTLLLLFAMRHGTAEMVLLLMLPTVVHVFIFTALFMLAGALKEKGFSGYLSLFTLLVCAASFWLFSIPGGDLPPHVGVDFFKPVASGMLFLSGREESASGLWAMFGFLSFAYTYHYLNWFSKTEIIRWHEIPRRRLAWIAGIYSLAIALYLYNYTLGFAAMLFLSLLHVLLEFPLNWRTLGFLLHRLSRPRPAVAAQRRN